MSILKGKASPEELDAYRKTESTLAGGEGSECRFRGEAFSVLAERE